MKYLALEFYQEFCMGIKCQGFLFKVLCTLYSVQSWVQSADSSKGFFSNSFFPAEAWNQVDKIIHFLHSWSYWLCLQNCKSTLASIYFHRNGQLDIMRHNISILNAKYLCVTSWIHISARVGTYNKSWHADLLSGVDPRASSIFSTQWTAWNNVLSTEHSCVTSWIHIGKVRAGMPTYCPGSIPGPRQ